MYQLFVVEDELLIRQNIRSMIENLSGPYVCCGEAADGEIALSMMQDIMPDILITDIRMPFLDGFELIRHARETMPWLKVIIISGYDDFDYAKRAISLNVDGYLLKPVKAAELKAELDKAAADIEKRRTEASFPAGYDREEVKRAMRQQFMQQLLYSNADTKALLDKARVLGLDIVRAKYRTAVMRFDCDQQRKQQLLGIIYTELMRQETELYLFGSPAQLTVLFYENDAELLMDKIYRFIAIMRHAVSDIGATLTCVTAQEVQRLSAVANAYAAAADLMNKAESDFTGRIVDAGDSSQLIAEAADHSMPLGDDFVRKLKLTAAEDVPQLISSMMNSADQNRFDSMLIRYQTLLGLMKLSVQMVTESDPDTDRKDIAQKLSESADILSASGNRKQFYDCAVSLIQHAKAMQRENNAAIKHSYVINRALEYVNENFCDPNITLISVARYIAMSPTHFSTVFSQTVGKSFINYLTYLRIEKAKKLLASSDMKLADIAMEIGYNEPNYFSHVFRKNEGLTPKDYRLRAVNSDQ